MNRQKGLPPCGPRYRIHYRPTEKGGLSILLVEQNLPMGLGVSDHVFIISKGQIVYESSPAQLRENEEVKVKYLCATE